MIGVIAYWEQIGVNTIYLKDIWKDTIKPLGANLLYYVDEKGIAPEHNDVEIIYKTFSTLEKAIAENPEVTYVYLEAERNIPRKIKYTRLKDFAHPKEDVIYVLGKDSTELPLAKLPLKGNHVVTIDTFQGYAIWALVAAGIALYDRKVKGEK